MHHIHRSRLTIAPIGALYILVIHALSITSLSRCVMFVTQVFGPVRSLDRVEISQRAPLHNSSLD